MLAALLFIGILILGAAFCLAAARAIRSKERLVGMDGVAVCASVAYGFFHAMMDFGAFMEYEMPDAEMSGAALTLSNAVFLSILAIVPALIFGYVVYRCRDRVVKFAIAVILLLADFVLILFGFGGIYSHSLASIREAVFPFHGIPAASDGIARGAAYILSHLFTFSTILYVLWDLIGLFFSRLRGKRGAAMLAGALALAVCGLWTAGAVKQHADKEKFANRSILRAVVREENGRGETAYYGITADKDYGRIEPFEPVNGTVYHTQYAGVSLYKNSLTGLQVLDGEGHPVEKTPEMNRILELGGENEHAIMAAWLIRADDLWFLQVMLNVNLWTPYELYWYNPVSDRLVEMTTFDGKEVVGLEIADKAYFERMMKIGGE